MASTDIIPSVRIERMAVARAQVIEILAQAVELVGKARSLANAEGLGFPVLAIDQSRFSRWTSMDDPRSMEPIRHVIDAGGWETVMRGTGMNDIMSAQAKKEWRKGLESEATTPEFTLENVLSTFGALREQRPAMFEDAVIEIFRKLSWDYKANLPQKFGKRAHLSWFAQRGFHPSSEKTDRADDLERTFAVLDGKPAPDTRHGWYQRVTANRNEGRAKSEYMDITWYKKGTAKVLFLRPDLVDQMNKIIAKRFPGALPEPRE